MIAGLTMRDFYGYFALRWAQRGCAAKARSAQDGKCEK